MDPKLVALARAASEGEQCPSVNLLLSGGGLVIGQPVGHSEFDEPSKRGVEQRVWESLHMKGMRRRKDDEKLELYRETMKPLSPAFEMLAQATSEDDGLALTIKQAQWLPAAGDGLRVAAMRVPLVAVAAWWIGSGERIAAGSSWSFFFGGIVPIDE